MTATRSTAEEHEYRRHRSATRGETCAFCVIGKSDDQLVRWGKHFKVIKNIFPYSIWDGQGVADHLMLVPKQHTDTLADLPPEAAAEYVRLVGEYEQQGYNVYARAPSSTIKSVLHQHTHFIKPLPGQKRFVFMLKKPYIRISF